ncbi:PhnB protein [Cupriavidus metallidurans]|mgnify:FL=1|jgi:PhnB protein|uniref:VOC family protein n=1 Tax=Cupriavidus TaxID=106589 RepID=UPI000493327E|nr:VOC family protein [Cupriavidus metallidurans]AVA35435.1 VOC family protein [Cupriavidus metallidurans]KWW33227.1 hypothetical protein AU374_05596 [Cupriavidus metallidurans]MDE4920946.1 VOC family protein [Cupriavidus metallidurans]
MSSKVQPYLFFDGRAEEAAEFYKTALGAQVGAMLRYRDGPKDAGPGCGPAVIDEDKIMHMALQIGDAVIMGSDGEAKGKTEFKGFGLSLNVANAAECDKTMEKLAEGGQINMPPSQTFFSERFGMVTDKFGVMWMVIAGPKE